MTTATIDMKQLNRLAGNVGTRFHRDRRGKLSTKSPLVWKNAYWLAVMLMQRLGIEATEQRSSDKEKYHLVLEGL